MASQPATIAQIDGRIAAIEQLDLDALRAMWRSQWGPAPTLRSPDLLRMIIGWRLQAHVHGGLDDEIRRKVRRKATIEAEGLALGAGATITRLWQGRTFEIEIEDKGFRWEGTLYPSLSAVATAITGVRQNGPRFFGMRDDRK
jgi:hypothetical protein